MPRKYTWFILLFLLAFNHLKAQEFIQYIFQSPAVTDLGRQSYTCALPGGESAIVTRKGFQSLVVTRFDKSSKVLWSKEYPFTFNITPFKILVRDNQLLVVGSYNSPGDLDILFFFRVAMDGSIVSFKYFIPEDDEIPYLYGVHPYGDGVFVTAVRYGVIGGGSGPKGRLAIVFDKDDKVTWCLSITGYETIWGQSGVLKDGGVLLSSYNRLSKFDNKGWLFWSHVYNNMGFIMSPVEIGDDIYVCSYDYNADYSRILKLNQMGEVIGVSQDFESPSGLKLIIYGQSLVTIGSVFDGTQVRTVATFLNTDLQVEKQLHFDNYFGYAPIGSLRDACTYDHISGSDGKMLIAGTAENTGFFIAKGNFGDTTTCLRSGIKTQPLKTVTRNDDNNVTPHLFTIKHTGTLANLKMNDISWNDQTNCCSKFSIHLPNDTALCIGNNVKIGIAADAEVLWNTGATTDSITVKDPGMYWVKAYSACDTLIDTIQVSFSVAPVIDFEVTPAEAEPGEEISFSDASSPGQTHWFTGDGFDTLGGNFTYAYEDNGLYYATHIFTDTFGCIYRDSTLIKISSGDYYIPNSFSPNGDGLNDLFAPVGPGVERYDLKIFNRWGQLVHDEDTRGWDGKFKGELVMPGVYFYLMRVSLFGSERWINLKGMIYLDY